MRSVDFGRVVSGLRASIRETLRVKRATGLSGGTRRPQVSPISSVLKFEKDRPHTRTVDTATVAQQQEWLTAAQAAQKM